MPRQPADAAGQAPPSERKAQQRLPRRATRIRCAATVAGQSQLSTRTIVRVFFTLVALGVLLYVLYLVRSVIGLLLIAIFLAVALGPGGRPRRRAEAAARGRRSSPSSWRMFLAIFLIGLIVVPPIVNEVEAFADDVPNYISDIRSNKTLREYDDKYDITKKLEDQAKSLPSRLGDAAGALQAVTVGVFSTVLQLVTVLTITFFLLLDGGRIVNFILAQVRPQHQERVRAVAGDIYGATGGYVAGALALATAAGISTYILLSILGVPFAVPLSVLMAFFDLIPLVGSTIGGVLVGVVTLFADFPSDTIIWVVFVARLPAGREQRVPADRLPPHGQPAPARGDHRDPHRVEPARGARRAGGDPDRRRDPDRAQGLCGATAHSPSIGVARRAAPGRRRRRAAARGRAPAGHGGGRATRSARARGRSGWRPARPQAPATARAAAAARPR